MPVAASPAAPQGDRSATRTTTGSSRRVGSPLLHGPARPATTPQPRPVRAVQITRVGGPEVLDVVDLPDPVPGNGRQLPEVSAAGVDSADTHQRLSSD